MPGKLTYWVADWNLTRARAAQLIGKDAADMVDCTHDALAEVRHTSIKRIAGYVTGTPDIRWTPEDFAVASVGRAVLKIDQSNSNLPLHADIRQVAKDVEGGASNIATAVEVAKERIPFGDDYCIYCDLAILPEVETAMHNAGFQGTIIGYQWASPSSNPATILPGTGKTLREANADLSVVNAAWMPLPTPPPPPEKLPRAIVEYDPDDFTWKISNYPWGSEPVGQ